MINNFNELKSKAAPLCQECTLEEWGENIMSDVKREDFKYWFNERYLIEITDDESGRTYWTKRIGSLAKAVRLAAGYNMSMGLTAEIYDTQTGETV